jgi:hypothetical protein
VTDITHYWDLKKKRDIVLVTPMSDEQGLAIVLPEGSPPKERVDDFLEEFAHSRSYFTLLKRYFGQEAADRIRAGRSNRPLTPREDPRCE